MTALTPTAILPDAIKSYAVGDDTVILLPDGATALVTSKSEPGMWREVDVQSPSCLCKGFEYRGHCRHINAVRTAQEMDRAEAVKVERPRCPICQRRPVAVILGKMVTSCACCALNRADDTMARAMAYDPERQARTGYSLNN